MNIFKKKIFKASMLFVILTILFLTSISCSGNSDSGDQKTKAGVISLLDSLGVGDVPKFPGADLEVELYRNMDPLMNELPEFPEIFKDSIFFPYITRKTPEDVQEFYNSKMKELAWEFVEEHNYDDAGNFFIWRKMANTGFYITYGVFVGNYEYKNRTGTLILSGFIVPKEDIEKEQTTTSRAEEETIYQGTVYFENTMPPGGQGLLPIKAISAGIEDWELWLQEGAIVKGKNEVSIVNDPMFLKSVMFKRISEPDDGGAAGIYYKTDIDVSSFENLFIWLVGRIENENGGNIANTDPQWFPEGALQIKIKYADANDKDFEWYHGFYYSDFGNPDSAHFSRVNKGDYFWYQGPDMTELKDKPAVIKEIWAYGFGWDFVSYLTEINIIGDV
ncbi:MAG: hypothetical protein PHU65_08315 [Actinomycetota bacterium]|nr:hypothetical protein [Actinomycetota bacterium]